MPFRIPFIPRQFHSSISKRLSVDLLFLKILPKFSTSTREALLPLCPLPLRLLNLSCPLVLARYRLLSLALLSRLRLDSPRQST